MQIKFIFDIASPNAYLSHKVIPDFEKKYDVKFDYFVCLLGGIFKLSNNGLFSNFFIFNCILPLKLSFRIKSFDKISFKNKLFENNFLSLRLSKDEFTSKLNGSKNIFPEKINLLFFF